MSTENRQEHRLRRPDPIGDRCTFLKARDTSGPRPKSALHAIVIHCTGADNKASSTAAYFHDAPGAGSTQLVVDDHSCYRCVPDLVVPWGAPPMNDTGLHVELEGPVDWSAAQWKAHPGRLDRAALHVARWHRRYDVPLRYAWTAAGLPADPGTFHGITCHAAISNRYHQSTHLDPGLGFPTKDFERRVALAVQHLQ